MFVTAKTEKISLYDMRNGKITTRSKDEWITFIAKSMLHVGYPFSRKYNIPDVLKMIQLSGNDLIAIPCYTGEIEYYLRPYYFYSEDDGRTIDPRYWTSEIYQKRNSIISEKHNFDYIAYIAKKNGTGIPRFRIDPVPGTGKRYGRSWLRCIRTTNERRQNADPEIEEFVRPARRPNVLPNAYDDIFRPTSRSWKNQGKFRHQWERKALNEKKERSA